MSTRTVLFAFSICLGIGGSRLCVAQPTVPKPPKAAPVPERIVPGAPTDPNKARIIGPGSAPEKVQIAPGTVTPGIIALPGANTPAAKVDPESLNQKGVTDRFVMALAQDKSGCLWVGTEDEGVWRYDEKAPEAKRWRQFTTKDGLGDDNAYAVACDNQGRVWIGHLNHGVSVFNGQSWKNYDVLDGPLGECIFDIAVAPTDGSVWIATNAGLARYSESPLPGG